MVVVGVVVVFGIAFAVAGAVAVGLGEERGMRHGHELEEEA